MAKRDITLGKNKAKDKGGVIAVYSEYLEKGVGNVNPCPQASPKFIEANECYKNRAMTIFTL